VSAGRRILSLVAAFVTAAHLASAQQPGKVWKIGVLGTRTRPKSLESDLRYGHFLRRLRELGYTEGKNVLFEWRFADNDYGLLPDLAAELVGLRVDAIVTDGTPGIRAAQEATTRIPIVFVGGTDVVAQGFVQSLAHPGGNTTGVTLLLPEIESKELEFLASLLPKLSRVAVLGNSANPAYLMQQANYRVAADKSKVQLVFVGARTPKEIEDAISLAARHRSDALICALDNLMIDQRRQIADLAMKYRLPSISAMNGFPENGGLISYATSSQQIWRRIGEFVDTIFRGASPADIPVEQPTKLELVINRKTARALGIEIPPQILVLADKVIG
jgi:putative tryptophan/tyrosine transport system substrate-binding protein